jgi:PIN domain nuclease of toxin-antitoxin system
MASRPGWTANTCSTKKTPLSYESSFRPRPCRHAYRYVSAVSIWEIVVTLGLGKLGLPKDWAETLGGEPFRRLPVTWEHALELRSLPDPRRDPFDRLLLARAAAEKPVLVTHDKVMLRYHVGTLPA